MTKRKRYFLVGFFIGLIYPFLHFVIEFLFFLLLGYYVAIILGSLEALLVEFFGNALAWVFSSLYYGLMFGGLGLIVTTDLKQKYKISIMVLIYIGQFLIMFAIYNVMHNIALS